MKVLMCSILFTFFLTNSVFATEKVEKLRSFYDGKITQLQNYNIGKYSVAKSEIILNDKKISFNTTLDNTEEYSKSFYKYRITTNNNEVLYEGGTKKELPIIDNFDSEKTTPSFLYELKLNNNVVGWIFGWNKDNYYKYYGTDFSVARVFIPYIDNNEIKLYNKKIEGIKFTDIGNYLTQKNNEIKIIHTEPSYGIFSCGACMGYYYVPSDITIKNTLLGIKIKENKFIDISKEFIVKNPEYAYSIAFHYKNFSKMDEAYKLFKHKLVDVSNKCSEYQRELSVFIENDEISFEQYWDTSIHKLSENDAYQCLTDNFPEQNWWHLFMRTGLFPTTKVIETYIQKSLTFAK